MFSDIRAMLAATDEGLTAESGSCRLAVFHADRYSGLEDATNPRSNLRLISTTALLPVYCYQVVAESATGQPLTFSLNAPVPSGMTIDSKTGKIIWDLYGTPSVAPGTYTATVQVTDPLGNQDIQSLAIIVSN